MTTKIEYFSHRDCCFLMFLIFGWMTVKSLRMLFDTAMHMNVTTYERLAEVAFGKSGEWNINRKRERKIERERK